MEIIRIILDTTGQEYDYTVLNNYCPAIIEGTTVHLNMLHTDFKVGVTMKLQVDYVDGTLKEISCNYEISLNMHGITIPVHDVTLPDIHECSYRHILESA